MVADILSMAVSAEDTAWVLRPHLHCCASVDWLLSPRSCQLNVLSVGWEMGSSLGAIRRPNGGAGQSTLSLSSALLYPLSVGRPQVCCHLQGTVGD